MDNKWMQVMRLFIIGGSETWYVHFSLIQLTGYRPRLSKAYIATLTIYFLLTIFDAYNDFPVYFVFTLAYVLITITVQLFYKASNVLKLGAPFVSIAVNYSATLFSSTLVWILYDDSEPSSFSINLRQSITSQIPLIIIACLMIYMISFGVYKKSEVISNVFTVAILPMITIMLIINEYYRYKDAGADADLIKIDNCVIAMLLFFISLTFFFLTTTSSSFSDTKDYSNTLEQMISMQAKYYGDLEKHQVELRKINHDIKNHTRMMSNLLNAGEVDELSEYINAISDYVSNVAEPVTKCDNMLISALLNDKLSMAKQNDIGLDICVMVPAELEVNNVDMCIILGNMLDNAVDACSNMSDDEDKFIEVDIRIMNAFLIIRVANSYSAPVIIKNKEYITTKRDRNSHGLGMKNIRRVVEKYEGRLNISHEGSVFTVTAILAYPVDLS